MIEELSSIKARRDRINVDVILEGTVEWRKRWMLKLLPEGHHPNMLVKMLASKHARFLYTYGMSWSTQNAS